MSSVGSEDGARSGIEKTYYELLGLPHDALPEAVKRAFRREIAKYHPDKVQHLGREFQEIAAVKAAELTRAYKTLTDAALRALYDGQIAHGETPAPVTAPAPPAPAAEASPSHVESTAPRPVSPPRSSTGGIFVQERAGADEFVRKATVMRFRTALAGEFGEYEQVRVDGFEVACIPKAAFWSLKLPPRVLGRFVPAVDAPTLVETWSLAGRMKKDSQRDLCVFLMGPAMASAGELAAAIADQRRKPMLAGGKLVMVPVSTKDWSAHVPTDAPSAVRSLLGRLKSKSL
jgi:hypothetical protein